MECLKINFIRPIINLEWNLKVKAILPELMSNESDELEKSVRSSPCRIKFMDDLIFYLELTSDLKLVARNQHGGLLEIIYGFALVKERAYLVKTNKELNFLDFLSLDNLDSADDVTFLCKVIADPSTTNATSLQRDMSEINEVLSIEELVCSDFERIMNHRQNFDGKIPKFTVEEAKELLTNEDVCKTVKILAVEYLAKSIETENVAKILDIAIEQDIKSLQKLCSEFLNRCTIQLKIYSSNSSISSSD